LLVNSPIAIGELVSSKVGNDIFRCDCPFIGHKLQNIDHFLLQVILIGHFIHYSFSVLVNIRFQVLAMMASHEVEENVDVFQPPCVNQGLDVFCFILFCPLTCDVCLTHHRNQTTSNVLIMVLMEQFGNN